MSLLSLFFSLFLLISILQFLSLFLFFSLVPDVLCIFYLISFREVPIILSILY